jgi:hypothetical protein
VQPHSLFTGGIQLDVDRVLDDEPQVERPLPQPQPETPRSHP